MVPSSWNLDGGAGFLLNAADNLAASADDLADLVDRDMDGLDARRVSGKLRARLGNLGQHGVEDERAAAFRLLERASQNLNRKALGLVVHLQGGDALGGARYLEVHVAQEVLKTLDVGQDHNAVVFLDKAHGDAGNRCAQRNAERSMSARVEPQVEAIEEEPLDSMTSETTRMA